MFKAKTKADIDNLIENGVDINAQDTFFGQTYLHILVQSNSPLLDYFLEKGPNTNIQNKSGKTPLYYAKDQRTIEKLTKQRASLLSQDFDGKACNHQAIPQVTSDFMTYYLNKLDKKR